MFALMLPFPSFTGAKSQTFIAADLFVAAHGISVLVGIFVLNVTRPFLHQNDFDAPQCVANTEQLSYSKPMLFLTWQSFFILAFA